MAKYDDENKGQPINFSDLPEHLKMPEGDSFKEIDVQKDILGTDSDEPEPVKMDKEKVRKLKLTDPEEEVRKKFERTITSSDPNDPNITIGDLLPGEEPKWIGGVYDPLVDIYPPDGPTLADTPLFKGIKIQLLEGGQLPTKGSDEAAAYDVYSPVDIELKPFEATMVPLRFKVEIPKHYKGELYTRSGYGKRGIFVVNQPGKIDSDYRGEMFAALLYIPQNAGVLINKMFAGLWRFANDIGGNARAIGEASAQLKSTLSDATRLDSYKVSKGDRIAQFEVQIVEELRFEQVDKLNETKRGEGGFGSSGK